ncbi:hypothetical protein K461DRAFT_290254 [Myriangium duriaei CBS 260.36]|uniref:UBA domain-containing protein n=1 Tax=Myriangium duriaei CBS 260.36 TaxID=1168546 RepID=A0A9P4MKA0_9PEZI|nr:hypothetical protein K461DRAFT_290254 [Myriangium duriaei CBS 260.36]
MAVEPTEENINLVAEVTQADRETARRYLKAKSNNAENAISALLDGEDISKAEAELKWDDGAWSADRDGGYTYGTNPGKSRPLVDHVGGEVGVSEAYPDVHLPAYNEGNLAPLGSSAVPTRGSSPVPSLRRPQTKAEEDEEMERALANSRQNITYNSQESGIVTVSDFHPATKAHYDPSRWAMTLHGSSNTHEAKEIVLDVDVAERRNQDGQPRFFKHLPSGDYLPSLLTIAHSIPAAREAMLLRSHVQPSYGQDSEWWRGQAIRLPRIVNTEDGSPADATAAENEDIVNEVQRLMAFLDGSDRSYGCIDNLTALVTARARKENTTSETVMDQTLQSWESAVCALQGGDHGVSSLFHSIVGTNHPSGNPSQDMWSLPLSISEDDRRRLGELTLADVMDSTLWDTDLEDENIYDTFMERCADILPMRVMQDSTSRSNLGLVVPAEIYVDKYLKENINSSRVVRRDIAATRKRISQLETLHSSISDVPNATGQGSTSALELIQRTCGLFSGVSRDAVLADYEARGIELPSGALDRPASEQSAHEAMTSRLDDLWSKIGSKLKVLEDEKIKARDLLAKLSQENPPGLEGSNLKHHYTLRGVSTKPNVTYILRRKPEKAAARSDPDLMDISSDPAQTKQQEGEDDPMADPDAPPGWMWWRIEFDSTHTPGRIMKTESTQDDVLRAVELEHSSALLVYASDRAMDFPSDLALPASLKTFVATDNNFFQQEMDQQDDDQWAHSGSTGARQDWGPVYVGDSTHSRSRRSSQGSTMVNFDEGDESGNGFVPSHEMDEAPPYSFSDGAHYGYENEKEGYPAKPTWDRVSPEAHEIHLDDTHDEGVEMTETGKGLLADSIKAGNRQSVTMGDLSESEVAGVPEGHSK